jgi:hypothetical protein
VRKFVVAPRCLLGFGLMLVALLVFSASALAGTERPSTGSFGPAGTGVGTFANVQGVTVDQTTGDVFVYDDGEGGRIYKFDAAGEPVDFSGLGTNVITGVSGSSEPEEEIAVDSSSGPASGDIYAANNYEVKIYSAAGSSLGTLSGGEMCGVAVDASGAVYVGVYSEGMVRKYVPTTNPVINGSEVASMGGLGGICNVAADSDGDLYAANWSGGVNRYEALQFGSPAAIGTPIDRSGRTLAVDPSSNYVYVDEGNAIAEYDAGGNLLRRVGVGKISGSSGVGVDSAKDELYVSSEGRVIVFGAPAIFPTVIGGKASEVTNSSATVTGSINPEGTATTYQFQYGTTTSYGLVAPASPQSVGSDSTTHVVSTQLTGLLSRTEYHYRLVAINSNGTSYGSDGTFATGEPPSVEAESSSAATSTEATLKANIDDGNAQSTYHFEYGPTSAYGTVTPEEPLSSEAQTRIVGLSPETTYHYRVVATNEHGTIDGEDETFTTAPTPSLVLPDGRRYEKVSPNNNADGNVVTPAPPDLATTAGDYTRLPFVAAADGSALAYVADPSESGGTGHEGAGGGNEYLSQRLPGGGWTAKNIEPESAEVGEVPVYQGFTKNLTVGFLTANGQQPLAAGAPGGGYKVPYKRTFSTGVFEALLISKPPNRGPEEFAAPTISTGGKKRQPAYAGSSADLSHVLFMANDALTPNAVDGGQGENNLYDSQDGALTLVNVLPDGSAEANATFGGPTLPSDEPEDGPSLSHDISEDGQRIFWTDLNNHDLYLREGGSRTVQVDAGAGGGGTFWTATPDGSKVLFTKGGDLYEYDVENGQTTDLVPGGEVQGIVGTSEDLSYIYFVADAALASGAKQQECLPYEGGINSSSCNLYVLHQGEPVRFIAELSPRDNVSFPQSEYSGQMGDWQPDMGYREAQVTPDGLHLVFGSERRLTGYHSNGNPEVFTYDYGDARLLCASCDPTGEASQGVASYGESGGSFLPVSRLNAYSKRWMNPDGSKVFFDSGDALAPQDTNGVVDVYEWEADGAGSCTRSQGCIYLLSAGSSPESSWLLDISESGDDVFIATRSQLTLEDQNESIDAYDVRANAPVPPAQPQCIGTGCQGVASSPPVFATPSSVTYNGVGNFAAPAKATGKAKKPKAKPKQKKHKKSKGSRHHKAKKSAHKSVKSHGRSK